MTTDRLIHRRNRADAGFTLLEVMIAMIILAVGLLSLQALGIGAIRAVHQGQKNTEFAVVATAHLEQAAHEVRNACAVQPEDDEEVHSDEAMVVTRAISTPDGRLAEITIEVAPSAIRAGVDPAPFQLTTRAFATGDCSE